MLVFTSETVLLPRNTTVFHTFCTTAHTPKSTTFSSRTKRREYANDSIHLQSSLRSSETMPPEKREREREREKGLVGWPLEGRAPPPPPHHHHSHHHHHHSHHHHHHHHSHHRHHHHHHHQQQQQPPPRHAGQGTHGLPKQALCREERCRAATEGKRKSKGVKSLSQVSGSVRLCVFRCGPHAPRPTPHAPRHTGRKQRKRGGGGGGGGAGRYLTRKRASCLLMRGGSPVPRIGRDKREKAHQMMMAMMSKGEDNA
jgi:hypothetical protein